MSEGLIVFLGSSRLGELHRQPSGKLLFEYDDSYMQDTRAIPLSLSMPLFEKRHPDAKISPFLWGLLPDNDLVIERLARRFQVSSRNCFGLLEAMGEDCAGAVRFVKPVNAERALEGGRIPLSINDIERRLAELKRDPALGRNPDDRGQFSLAGAQAKTALGRDEGAWYLPWGIESTTHILKPPRLDLEGHAENEHFCLRLARCLGMAVAKSEVLRFGKEPAIVIERYDRVLLGPTHMRVHQEDACQALSVHPAHKYQTDGGPGIIEVMGLLNRSTKSLDDRRRFIEAVLFNYLILGTDAHAKNFSLLLGSGSQMRLAPLYDLASLLPYSTTRREERFAMKIGGYYKDQQIQQRHFIKMAKEAEFPVAEMRDIMMRLASNLQEKMEQVSDEMQSVGIWHSALDTMKVQLQIRSLRILSEWK
jgi:serine/threonine-protein kinase HipA